MNIIDRFKLDGKVATVTGAGQGLGHAFAIALADAGANVVVSDVIEENVQKTAAQICKKGQKALAVKADVSNIADIDNMLAKTVECFGKLDIAVNNAGIAIPIQGAGQISEADWKHQMQVNLDGTFFCARAEAEIMREYGYGKIINIGSICGHIAWPAPQAAYSISKAGVIHMTKCLAAEYIKYGIRINCISPGVTRVEGLFDEVIDTFLQKAPIDRIGCVEDYQGAIVYLASEVSDFMIGAELRIDGGYTII